MLELQDEREERRSENQADGDTGDDEHLALLRGFASGWEPNEVVGCTARRAGITRYQARAERPEKRGRRPRMVVTSELPLGASPPSSVLVRWSVSSRVSVSSYQKTRLCRQNVG